MRRRFILLACVLGLCAAVVPRARADSSEGGAFLLPGYGARAWGMSGAVIARIDDESSVDWNPAGIARAPRSAGVSYVELVPESYLTQSQAVFVMPLGGGRDPETGVTRHAAGAMLTNLSADVGAGQTYSENYLRLAYAYSPEPVVTFAFGGQAFISRSTVSHFDGWGTAVDFAARLSITPRWSFAIVGRDVFSRYTYDDGSDNKKDAQYVAGLARRDIYGVDLEANVVYVHEGWHRGLFGAETKYLFGYVALRGGVAVFSAGEKRTGYSFGASARAAQRLYVHYGAQLDDEDAFGTMHRFSLAVTL